MTRTRSPYKPNSSVLDYISPVEYVKEVLDSRAPAYKGGYESEGHSILAARYSNLKSEEEKKLIAQAVVDLLDDPDYSCDAIPVAAELGLPEAKEWFLNLSKKPIEEIRQIKTNSYINGLFCLLNYIKNNFDDLFSACLRKILLGSKDKDEVFGAISTFSHVKPEIAVEELIKFLPSILQEKKSENEILSSIKLITSGLFKNYGEGYCIDLAKRFKENLPKEYQVLFYKALEQNPTPRFKPYLEELKKILEIDE